MTRVLLVSKPVEAPWNDSSKNLVRDLAGALPGEGVEPTVLVRQGGVGPAGVRALAAYPAERPALPAVAAQGMAFARLLRQGARGRIAPERGAGEARSDLWHFFFAPNPRGSGAARTLARAAGRPTVQTVCSEPPPGDPRPWLFADRVVVLSERVAHRLLRAGVAAERLVRIPPPVPDLAPLSPDARSEARAHFQLPAAAPLVVYPGDLEFGRGAYRVLEAFARADVRDAQLVMACRAKTARARDAERELRQRAQDLAPGRVQWVGETRRILALLGTADVVALPTETLYAKMDYPLAVLEAMRMARAVIVAADTAAAELEGGHPDGPALEVSAAEVDDLAGRLGRLLGDPSARARLGARARQRSEAFLPARIAAAHAALYREMLS
ncbi:MAG: glycosyltransferase family 4 protein [Myxococcota bacterium]